VADLIRGGNTDNTKFRKKIEKEIRDIKEWTDGRIRQARQDFVDFTAQIEAEIKDIKDKVDKGIEKAQEALDKAEEALKIAKSVRKDADDGKFDGKDGKDGKGVTDNLRLADSYIQFSSPSIVSPGDRLEFWLPLLLAFRWLCVMVL